MRCAESLQSLKLHFIFLGGMPPRTGKVRWRVDSWGMERERRVEVGVVGRCLPKWTRRRSGWGREVRRETRCLRVEMVVDGGMVSGIAGF